jgi:transposase
MGPRQVKAYRAGPHKSDARDAAAVAEAASRPAVKAIRVKSEAAQAVQALARVRARRTRQLTATSNQLRGLLAEFGLIAPKGRGALLKAVAAFKEAGALPEPVRVLIEELAAEVLAQARALVEADKALARRVGEDEAALRLMSIPFIGPVNAAGLSVALTAPGDFKDGRAFAACQGLAPRQDQSGERDRKTGIPRQCANDTRANLVCAAQALLTAVGRMEREPEDPFLAWARALKARKPRNVAAVAVAAKLARIAWSVAAGGAPYAPRRTQAQLEAARPAA